MDLHRSVTKAIFNEKKKILQGTPSSRGCSVHVYDENCLTANCSCVWELGILLVLNNNTSWFLLHEQQSTLKP